MTIELFLKGQESNEVLLDGVSSFFDGDLVKRLDLTTPWKEITVFSKRKVDDSQQ